MKEQSSESFWIEFLNWIFAGILLPYLFEYKTQKFELIFNKKLRVRPINKLKYLMEYLFKIPIFIQKLRVRFINVCALYTDKYGTLLSLMSIKFDVLIAVRYQPYNKKLKWLETIL